MFLIPATRFFAYITVSSSAVAMAVEGVLLRWRTAAAAAAWQQGGSRAAAGQRRQQQQHGDGGGGATTAVAAQRWQRQCDSRAAATGLQRRGRHDCELIILKTPPPPQPMTIVSPPLPPHVDCPVPPPMAHQCPNAGGPLPTPQTLPPIPLPPDQHTTPNTMPTRMGAS